MGQIFLRVIRSAGYATNSLLTLAQPSMDAAVAASGDGAKTSVTPVWAPTGANNWGTGFGNLPGYEASLALFTGNGDRLPFTLNNIRVAFSAAMFLDTGSGVASSVTQSATLLGSDVASASSILSSRYALGLGGLTGTGLFPTNLWKTFTLPNAYKYPTPLYLPSGSFTTNGYYQQVFNIPAEAMVPTAMAAIGVSGVPLAPSYYTLTVANLANNPNVVCIGITDVTYTINISDRYQDNDQSVTSDVFIAVPLPPQTGLVCSGGAIVTGSPRQSTPPAGVGALTISLQTLKNITNGLPPGAYGNIVPIDALTYPTAGTGPFINDNLNRNIASASGIKIIASLGDTVANEGFDYFDPLQITAEPPF